MYELVPRDQIIDALRHLRALLRQHEPSNERDRIIAERREIVVKYLISNLPRNGSHPTLSTVMEVVDTFLLTVGAAHKLFGYDIDAIRQYDLRWNGDRTHILESYVFKRDAPLELPAELAPESAFQADALLSDLIRDWQAPVPIGTLDVVGARRAFYVHVGTEDSRGSSLPPGSMALVEPVSAAEAIRPNPRWIYLLQFRNGYRCSRCVISNGRLHLIASARSYLSAREFAFPGEVRVTGRVRMFAHALPQADYERNDGLQATGRPADLILPWEHSSRDTLLLDEYRRFRRSKDRNDALRRFLESLLRSPLSKRTERRYRHSGSSEPHVSTLIQLTLLHLARYSDALWLRNPSPDDPLRYSLDTVLNARTIHDLDTRVSTFCQPFPEAVWNLHRSEFLEWLPLLSFKFPQLNMRQNHVMRLSRSRELPGLESSIAAGSWMLLKPTDDLSEASLQGGKSGWSRPIYVLRRGLRFFTGYLERDGGAYSLLSNCDGVPSKEQFDPDETSNLYEVFGVAVPV